MLAESGKRMGRNESVCGQIGVKRIAGTDGWTIEPPADMEYLPPPTTTTTIIVVVVGTKEK